MTESTSHGGSGYPSGLLIYRGAEADLIQGSWQGLEAVYKVRKPLRYRLPVLDDDIRRQRTLHEAEMIHQAKRAGVAAPYLYSVDLPSSTLVMEYVKGARLKDVISARAGRASSLFREFGSKVGLLHRAGIMHGDLTTANVVKSSRGLVFIDFGLSIRTERVEDHGVDIRLIKETLLGAHPEVAASAMEVLNRGYAGVVGPARSKAVFRQLLSIERRGRYARVT